MTRKGASKANLPAPSLRALLAGGDRRSIAQVERARRLVQAERARAIAILERDAQHPRKFVRAWAADGLARLARVAPAAEPALERVLRELESSGAKSLLARARAIRRERAGAR